MESTVKNILLASLLSTLGLGLGACGDLTPGDEARCVAAHEPIITYAPDSPGVVSDKFPDGTAAAPSSSTPGQKIVITNPAIMNDGCPPILVYSVRGFTGTPTFPMAPTREWNAYEGDPSGTWLDGQPVDQIPWSVNLTPMKTTTLYAGQSMVVQEVLDLSDATGGTKIDLGFPGPVWYLPSGSQRDVVTKSYKAYPAAELKSRLRF